MILGGPPCQGFSSHRINDAGVDDPRNKLLLRYFDFVCEFKPKAFFGRKCLRFVMEET